VLLEIQIAPPTQLPVEEGSFDIAVVDDTLGLVSSTAASVEALVREIRRVLRPAGRVVFVGGLQKRGLRASFHRQSAPPFVESGEAGAALQSGGFSAVRTVGECEQLVFVEGIAPRAAP
jgi:ubiquinone/menaquinone biosynthesis C-methylase UbiE